MVFTIEYCGVPFDCDITFDEDLKEIKITKFAVEHFKDITEVAGVFEIAEYLAENRHILLFETTSNSGGIGYYIPAKFTLSCPNILLSLRLSHEGDENAHKPN